MQLATSPRLGRPSRLFAAVALTFLSVVPALAAKVTFRYQPVIGGVNAVSVAGSFNGWNATANPLADPDKDGVWSADVELPAGRITYKFVVNGDQWFADENAAETESDGFGGQNAVLVVGAQAVTVGHGSTVKKAAPKLGLRQVLFRYKPATKPNELSLAGQFNDWTVGKTPMTDPDGDGVYTATLLLAPGSYQYKFVVNATGWTQDKDGQDAESDDGFGGKNSIRNVDERFPTIAVKKGDGRVFSDGIQHTQGAQELNALGEGLVELTARAHLDDVAGVDLVWWAPGGTENRVRMNAVERDRVYEYFRSEIRLPEGASYTFHYRDGEGGPWLGPKGLAETRVKGDAFSYDSQRFPPFVTPDWVKNGIIYQIFPDRFRNGNTANDPDFKEWYYEGKRELPPGGRINPDYQEWFHLAKWDDHAALTRAPHTPDGRDWMVFYGGDIEGVRQKLDYLKALGVTIIYFNPLFEAKSTHKYDAADYRRIDPHFGTNDEFKAFVKQAKAMGIRVVLDIVFNHSGNAHWAFKDAVEKGPASPYYTWFDFKQHPLPAGWPNVGRPWKPSDYYYCWWGFGDLPDLNFDLSRNDKAEVPVRDVKDAQVNVSLVKYLLDATEYWMKEVDADGVRLDVPNEVPYWFWKLFNQRVKKVKPDAYIVRRGHELRVLPRPRAEVPVQRTGHGGRVRRRPRDRPPHLPAPVRGRADEPARQSRHRALPHAGERRREPSAAGRPVPDDVRGRARDLLRRRGRARGWSRPRLPSSVPVELGSGRTPTLDPRLLHEGREPAPEARGAAHRRVPHARDRGPNLRVHASRRERHVRGRAQRRA
ncbi:MAG: hypothetical protein RLZZ93_1049 [Actinomycetota bacterium]